MIEACARHGYAETTTRELTALAAVSSKTLYQHFESKEALFLATYDVVVQRAIGRISAAYRGASGAGRSDWAEGLCRAFDAFADELVQRPAPSRLALIEIFAAGPDALVRIERAELLFAAMISNSVAQAPDGVVIPPKIVRDLIGGVWFVGRTRLLDADPQPIATCGAELRTWLLAYRSAAGSRLPATRLRRKSREIDDRPIGPTASVRTRMLRAAATTVARGGYEAMSPLQIAAEADVSAAVFEAEFEDTRGCFLSMLEWLSARALAEALRESEGAPSWANSVCRAIESLFCHLAAEPALARAAFLDGFVAGPAGEARRAAIMRGFAEVFARRAPTDRRPSPLVAEVIVGSVWSIAHRLVVRGQRRSLPAASTRAAFVALAPIVGADAALAAILAEHSRH